MMAVPHEDYDALTKMWEKEIDNPNEFICARSVSVLVGVNARSFNNY